MLDVGLELNWRSQAWSPDGAYLILNRGHTGDDAGMDLYSAAGTLVRRHDHRDRAQWVDADHYLLVRFQATGTYEGSVVDVQTGEAVEMELPTDFAIGDGHGTLAFIEPYRRGPRCVWGCPDPKFQLWTMDGGFGAWHTGMPLGWTQARDGLFVLNVEDVPSKPIGAPAAPAIKGWLEVLGLPDLESVRRYQDVRMFADLLAIDPNGAHVAFYPAADGRWTDLEILDLESGEVSSVATHGYAAVWNDASQLIVGPTNGGEWVPSGAAAVLDAHGLVVTTWPHVGEHLSSTPDGSAVLFAQDTGSNGTPPVTIYSDGQRLDIPSVSSPGLSFRCLATLAPNRAALALTCNYYDERGEADSGIALLRRLP